MTTDEKESPHTRADAVLTVNPQIAIPEEEFHWSFARSGGPGGQNVNKVSSKAVLRWDLTASPSLPEAVKARLRMQQPGRITTEGELVLSSERWRDQPRNREDCLEKLRQMLLAAAVAPKARKATRPTRGAQRARLAAKRHRSATKKQRRVSLDD
jgi:ribosome-associated protein